MKCDELKAIKADTYGDVEMVYPKSDVDAAIAELKDENATLRGANDEKSERIVELQKQVDELKQKLQDQCVSCPVKMQEDDVVAEKDKVIAELKQKLESVQASMYADVVDANMENRRLKEERRWRNFSEEKPEHHQWILVFYPNHSQFTTGVELRRWDDGCKYDVEEQGIYDKWMPLPEPPKEADK